MSTANKISTDQYVKTSDCEPLALSDTLGSHYALQVALQTMKERCQQLQLRLAVVEEENLHLRGRKENLPCEINSFPSVDKKTEVANLEAKVLELTRQKSQLSHHITMVASENQQLWNRLSRVMQVNQSLGSHLTKISDTLSLHDSIGNTDKENKQQELKGCIPRAKSENCDVNQQSLDEISLKLINSLRQEKADLEEQYLQMVDTQTDMSYPIQNLGFSFLDKEDEAIVKEVNEHCEKLREMKDVLKEQQNVLKTAVNYIGTNIKDKLCSQCRRRSKYQSTPEDHNDDEACINKLRQWGTAHHIDQNEHRMNQVEDTLVENLTRSESSNINHLQTSKRHRESDDRICPMCGKFFPKLIPFDDFQNHVVNHFAEENFDPQLDNFEVVT